MEKKYFFAIPILFVLFSILFPMQSGTDFHFEDIKKDSGPVPSDVDGKVCFPYFPGKICTVCKKSDSLSVLGFLDGELLLRESDSPYKKLIFDNKSRIKAVYSIAISDNEKYVAALVGADPKSLFIFEDRNGEWVLLRQDRINSDKRGLVYLGFAGDVLLYEVGGTIAAYSLKDASYALMNMKDEILAVASDSEKNYFWVLSRHNLHAFRYNGSPVSVMPYSYGGNFLRQSGDTLTLDIGGRLCSARLVEGQ